MQLKKVLSLRTVVATSAGLTFASASFVAAVQVANYMAGESAWLAILIGGLLCLTAASCFSELNGALPSAAGIRLYFSRAFNERMSLTISILYMVVILGVIGAESYVLASVFKEALPGITPVLWIILLLAVVTVMNIRGIKIAGAFQDLITYGLTLSLIVIAGIALFKVNFQLEAPLYPGSIVGVVNAVAVGVFLFVGFEWVTPLAEEVTDNKLISKGMYLAIGLLSVTYALVTVAMTASVPKELLSASAAPHILFAREILGNSGLIGMLLLSLAASVTTFNAGLISVSRFMYASAREHVLPKVFSKVSIRYFTPYIAIWTLFAIGLVISVVVLLTGRYMMLVNMAAAMESIVYALAGLAVIRLRKKEPELARNYRVKGGNVIPWLACIIFSVLVLAVLITNPPVFIYLLCGFGICFLYVNKVVPRLKKKYTKQRRTRKRTARRET